MWHLLSYSVQDTFSWDTTDPKPNDKRPWLARTALPNEMMEMLRTPTFLMRSPERKRHYSPTANMTVVRDTMLKRIVQLHAVPKSLDVRMPKDRGVPAWAADWWCRQTGVMRVQRWPLDRVLRRMDMA